MNTIIKFSIPIISGLLILFLGIFNISIAAPPIIEQIDGGIAANDVGKYSSIALDSLGNSHVAYYDFTNEDLKYASNTGGSWSVETVMESGEVGMFVSLAIDLNGFVHISYYDRKNNLLKYITNRSSKGWSDDTVDGGAGDDDDDDDATDDDDDATDDDDDDDDTVDDDDDDDNDDDDAVDDDDDSTADDDDPDDDEIDDDDDDEQEDCCGGCDETSDDDNGNENNNSDDDSAIDDDNDDSTVDDDDDDDNDDDDNDDNDNNDDDTMVGAYSSIAVDDEGIVHISYVDDQYNVLKYATNVRGQGLWTRMDVDWESGVEISHTSISLDSLGGPSISYIHTDSMIELNKIQLAQLSASQWDIVEIDSFEGAIDASYNTSLHVGTSDSVHIAYTVNIVKSTPVLSYATDQSGSWEYFDIDDSLSAGGHVSLLQLALGEACATYRDSSSSALRYAHFESETWNNYIVDNNGNRGKWTSLAIDTGDNAVVSYYGDYALWHATFEVDYSGSFDW